MELAPSLEYHFPSMNMLILLVEAEVATHEKLYISSPIDELTTVELIADTSTGAIGILEKLVRYTVILTNPPGNPWVSKDFTHDPGILSYLINRLIVY